MSRLCWWVTTFWPTWSWVSFAAVRACPAEWLHQPSTWWGVYSKRSAMVIIWMMDSKLLNLIWSETQFTANLLNIKFFNAPAVRITTSFFKMTNSQTTNLTSQTFEPQTLIMLHLWKGNTMNDTHLNIYYNSLVKKKKKKKTLKFPFPKCLKTYSR